MNEKFLHEKIIFEKNPFVLYRYRGVDVPMLVVFIGAIGGFILNGIIDLFIGAIILSVGFKLFQVWLKDGSD